MFQRARLLLTLSYAAALVLILLGVGLSVYFLIRNDANSDIDDSLRAAARSLDGLALVTPVSTPGPSTGHDNEDDDDDDDDEHDQRSLAQLPSDIFYVVFDAGGAVLANPRQINLEGVDLAKLGATTRVRHSREVHGSHGDYRLSMVRVKDGQYLAVGRSLSLMHQQLNTLRTVFLAGGGIGLLAAVVSGFWLSGRTLRPIRRALESQRQFVSDASHELRTPITVARANNALLLSDPEGTVESHLEQAEAVSQELDHLSVLVGDLTTLARADEGRANLLLGPLGLSALVEEVVRDMSALADLRGVGLHIDAATPVQVNGDPARLRQLLVILIDNGLKYAPAGGEVRVRCTGESGEAEVTVTDNGPGISAEDQRHIFERFYRVEAERTRAKGGTGLGLAIARWIAEAHGGRLTVASQPGAGTTFRLRLPAAR